MNKTVKFILLSVSFCTIIIVLLSIPIGIGQYIVPDAYAAVPEPGSLTVLSLTGIYFALKALRRKSN
jgi:hypothetical protein